MTQPNFSRPKLIWQWTKAMREEAKVAGPTYNPAKVQEAGRVLAETLQGYRAKCKVSAAHFEDGRCCTSCRALRYLARGEEK